MSGTYMAGFMPAVSLGVAYVQLAWTQCGCTEAGRGDRNFGIWSSWHAKFNSSQAARASEIYVNFV